MILPTVHLNGTGAQDLFDGYKNARTAVNDAIDAICKIEFNARDYYPQGPDAYSEARKEQIKRVEMMQSVSDDFLTIAMHIQDVAKPGSLS